MTVARWMAGREVLVPRCAKSELSHSDREPEIAAVSRVCKHFSRNSPLTSNFLHRPAP